MAEQSRAEIGRAGFLRRGEAKKPGTTNIASLAARLLARPLALAFADERSCPPVPRFLSQQLTSHSHDSEFTEVQSHSFHPPRRRQPNPTVRQLTGSLPLLLLI